VRLLFVGDASKIRVYQSNKNILEELKSSIKGKIFDVPTEDEFRDETVKTSRSKGTQCHINGLRCWGEWCSYDLCTLNSFGKIKVSIVPFRPLCTRSSLLQQAVLEMGRYMSGYHIFVPEFHTGTYQCTISVYLFSIFLMAYPCFAFKKYTETSKFPFRALITGHTYTHISTVRAANSINTIWN
jgi:hypothetical protein